MAESPNPITRPVRRRGELNRPTLPPRARGRPLLVTRSHPKIAMTAWAYQYTGNPEERCSTEEATSPIRKRKRTDSPRRASNPPHRQRASPPPQSTSENTLSEEDDGGRSPVSKRRCELPDPEVAIPTVENEAERPPTSDELRKMADATDHPLSGAEELVPHAASSAAEEEGRPDDFRILRWQLEQAEAREAKSNAIIEQNEIRIKMYRLKQARKARNG